MSLTAQIKMLKENYIAKQVETQHSETNYTCD